MADYLKAIPSLIISNDNGGLHKKFEDLREKSKIEGESLKERQKKQNEKIEELQAKVDRLISIMVKEGKEGRPVFRKREFNRLVENENAVLEFNTVDCEYKDPIFFEIPGKNVLVIRKELERRKQKVMTNIHSKVAAAR